MKTLPAKPVTLFSSLLVCLLLIISSGFDSHARPNLVKNIETLMEIPGIKAVTSSEAHLYVLSEREGLVVFRAKADSLQWLYSSSGLSDRGDRLVTDIRFSYLFGKDNRLTVIEPTSVLGVYSSTRLDFNPEDVLRMENDLFIAGCPDGICTLSLESSESVDSDPETVFRHEHAITSLARVSDQLFALDNRNKLHVFDYENGELSGHFEQDLPDNASKLHNIERRLYMSTSDGMLYRVRTDGRSDELFSINEAVTGLEYWNDHYFLRGESNRLWIAGQGLRPAIFRDDTDAGNHITTLKDQIWISDYREFSRWEDAGEIATLEHDTSRAAGHKEEDVDESLKITSINDKIIPYPRPLLVALDTESKHSIDNIRFQQRSNIDGIQIQGNSLYWQPSSSDVGSHRISVIASTPDGQSDSTSFQVTIRPFNNPPRFRSIRPLSIPVNEEFSISIQASDPDGTDADLIRYIGVDLPDGAKLDERSGKFEWTPSRRQTGEHSFEVIATDQYGAAASQEVTINVIELDRDES